MSGISANQVVAVIVRLFAIALFVYAIRQTPELIVYFIGESSKSYEPEFYGTWAFFSIGVIILCVGAALFLWNFPTTVATKVTPRTHNEATKNWDDDSLLSVGFIILGVYFYYYVIIDLLYWGMLVVLSIRHDELVSSLEIEQWINVVLTFVELFLATMLVFRSRGIANLILKFRGRLE